MRSLLPLAVVACLVCAWPAVSYAGEVSLVIRDGRVTLVARDVTVRHILAEWARVGKTTIVNLDRVPGGPISIELRDVPEARALDTIMRSIGGFMAARRPIREPGLSEFDRIVVMPVLASAARPPVGGDAVRQGVGAAPSFRPQPPVRPDPALSPFRPDPGESSEEQDPDEGAEPVTEDENDASPSLAGRPPIGMRQPGMAPPPGIVPPTQNPSGPPTLPRFGVQPGGATAAPSGAPTPGVVVPARPGQPGQPPKPPGEAR